MEVDVGSSRPVAQPERRAAHNKTAVPLPVTTARSVWRMEVTRTIS